jgi:type I restriction enzyme M protein
VPCQLWFFDRAKERDPDRADHVLMLDARNIYRKVSRAIYDFSPEQQKNIAAIVWLYRGQADRFLELVESYLAQAVAEGQATTESLADYNKALGKLIELVQPFVTEKRDPDPLAETWDELTSAGATLAADIAGFDAEVAARAASWAGAARDNAGLHAARTGLHSMAERCRDMTKQIDLAAKLAGRMVDTAIKELDARDHALWPNAEVTRARKALEGARVATLAALEIIVVALVVERFRTDLKGIWWVLRARR